jgi:hypothetical protein
LVGSGITGEHRGGAISGHPGRPIMIVDFSPMLRDIAVDVMKTAHKAKNVHKYLKKP